MQFNIRKRTGEVVAFDQSKITNAIYKAAKAVGGKDRKLALELSNKVFLELQARFPGDDIPPVEAVQDLVEKVLIEAGHAKTAKAYILYRKQHEDLRDVEALMNSFDLIHGYIGKTDWKVNENANMTYSLQGLNNYIAGEVIANYWLRKIYPAGIGDSHVNGDLHIHDLGTLGPYCVGWDLQDLLMEGFGHVSGKIDSKPAGHFRTALGQVVNFFYTLQGEAAGAQAFSSFDTLLAPFIRHDNLSYAEVKQCMQEFTFNVNVPTRVGFQCMSEDTSILTPDGWRTHGQLKVGDVIRTFNTKTGQVEDKPIKRLFSRHYKGKMYNLRNRVQDQLVTPEHRVVRKPFNSPSQEYVLEPIEKVLELKSPVIVPLAGANARPDAQISDDEIRLLAWLIAEGTSENPSHAHRQSGRITLTQSATANGAYCEEIQETLDSLGLEYGLKPMHGTQYSPQSTMNAWRINAESSRRVNALFGGGYDIKFIPPVLRSLSQRQARLFLGTYRKADGQKDAFKISVSDDRVLEGLQQIACDAGYGFTTLDRGATAIGTKPVRVLRIIEHPDTYIQEIREVNYEGVVWCPNTDNETVIAQRNGKAFITGNTPFTNITMDLSAPKNMADSPAIIGGKPVGAPYGDYAEEMTMLNRAFAETMMEGDAKGRVFTFPIPTYNVTKDFPWESDVTQKIFEMTAKYGIPYFANFINSDMSTEDARSMCCRLRLDNRELRKRGGGLFGANPLTGSIGVVTINMPRLGYLSKGEDEFFERLLKLMDVARDSLELKRKILENFTEKGMYPYSKYYLRTVREATGAYWTNHFNTIGLVGMNEALTHLLGTTIATKEGIAFAAKTLDFMRDRLADYQEETGNYYNLEATPAEGTSYRLARSDKKRYPDILVANNSPEAKLFYTNSTQLPVNHTTDIFEALELQEPLQTRYTGGTVLHGFLGERIDWRAARSAVKRIAENYHLPYFTLTPTFSICPKHGYIAGEHVYCPICDSEIGLKEGEEDGKREDEVRSVQQDSRILAADRPME